MSKVKICVTFMCPWLPAGRYIPQPLPDRRTAPGGKLPAALNATSVLAVEGGSLNWLFKNIIRFAGWAPCEVLTGSKAPWRAPPGFRRLALLNLTQDLTADYNLTATSKSLPAVVVLKQGNNRPRNGTCWGFVREAARPGQVVGGAGAAAQLCSGGHLVVLIRGTLTVAESKLGELPAASRQCLRACRGAVDHWRCC